MKINISTAVIFCGGRGKRLKPITNKIPKPLALVCGRPFIFYIIEQLISFKIQKVIFLTGYKSEIFKNKVKKLNLPKKIKYVFKKTPVNWETGKRLNFIRNLKEMFFLLLYSDNLIYFDYIRYINSLDSKKIINIRSTSKNVNQNPEPVVREEHKIGRNEIVKISNGNESKEMKYKKAKPLIDSGEWRIT